MSKQNGIYTTKSTSSLSKTILKVVSIAVFIILCAIIGFVISLRSTPNKELEKTISENVQLKSQIEQLKTENKRLKKELDDAKDYTITVTPSPEPESDEDTSLDDNSYDDDEASSDDEAND